MGLEQRERRDKIVAEWRRMKTQGQQSFDRLAEIKATGLALRAEIQASVTAGDGLYDASDVADMQAAIDWYTAEVAKL